MASMYPVLSEIVFPKVTNGALRCPHPGHAQCSWGLFFGFASCIHLRELRHVVVSRSLWSCLLLESCSRPCPIAFEWSWNALGVVFRRLSWGRLRVLLGALEEVEHCLGSTPALIRSLCGLALLDWLMPQKGAARGSPLGAVVSASWCFKIPVPATWLSRLRNKCHPTGTSMFGSWHL